MLLDPFHDGERTAQRRAGEAEMAARVGAMIKDSVGGPARVFLEQQAMVVIATAAEDGSLWASPLFGEAGLVRSPDGRELVVDLDRIARTAADPFWSNVQPQADLGLLAIDFTARKRLRVNGRVRSIAGAQMWIEVREAYPNCPKYIHERRRKQRDDPRRDAQVYAGTRLDAQRAGIAERADTFFIASAHPDRGADASHRGGPPGFVQAVGERTLRVPDYAGNGMFNTIGNLLAHPRAGVTFVDFERGRVLWMTGSARVCFDGDDPRGETGGTRRSWELDIERWIDAPLPVGWGWERIER